MNDCKRVEAKRSTDGFLVKGVWIVIVIVIAIYRYEDCSTEVVIVIYLTFDRA